MDSQQLNLTLGRETLTEIDVARNCRVVGPQSGAALEEILLRRIRESPTVTREAASDMDSQQLNLALGRETLTETDVARNCRVVGPQSGPALEKILLRWIRESPAVTREAASDLSAQQMNLTLGHEVPT